MEKQTKTILILSAGAGIFLASMTLVSVYRYNKLEAERAKTKVEAERVQKQRTEAAEAALAAFKVLSPADHLREAKRAIDAANSEIAHNHLDEVPMGTQGLEPARKKLAELDAKEKAAKELEAKKTLAKLEADEIKERKNFARKLENSYLDHGFNIDVTTQGPKANVLRMKYALTSKVLARQITTSDVLNECRAMGFRKVILTNGFESDLAETYYWDLVK